MPQFREEREIRTYVYLYCAAKDSLEKAEAQEEGSWYSLLACLIFSAFSLEAYLNHLGERVIDYWAELEKLAPLSKLKILYSRLSLSYDSSRRPVQTITQLFKFRNLMAHAKTEIISGVITANAEEMDPSVHLIETEWEKFCNIREAKHALEDVKALIEVLNAAAGHEEDPLGILEDVELWGHPIVLLSSVNGYHDTNTEIYSRSRHRCYFCFCTLGLFLFSIPIPIYIILIFILT